LAPIGEIIDKVTSDIEAVRWHAVPVFKRYYEAKMLKNDLFIGTPSHGWLYGSSTHSKSSN